MRRLFLFLVLILFGSFFASGAYASGLVEKNLDIKEINGTEFTLLSNTDQCLVECEAWIQWDLTQGIASNVLLPVEKTSQFGFEIIKEKAWMRGLETFDVSVYGLVKGEWVYLAPFYGFQAEHDQIYRIKVSGTRKANINQNNVDWIPTFFGEEIIEWAWWNSSWLRKQKLTVNTTGITLGASITDDMVVMVDVNAASSPDFWANVEADGDSVRFLSNDELTEYKFYVQEWDYVGEHMVAWVYVTDTFSDVADLDLYMYYENGAAADGEDAPNTLVDYEAVYHADESGVGMVLDDATTGFDATVSNALIWNAVNKKIGAGAIYTNDLYYATQGTLLDVVPANLAISFWFRIDATWNNTSAPETYFIQKENAAPGQDTVQVRLQTDGKIRVNGYDGGVNKNATTTTASWTGGTWYNIIAGWDTTNGLTIYKDGVLEASDGTATTLMANGFTTNFTIGADTITSNMIEGTIDEIRILNKTLTADKVKLLYNSEADSLIVFGVATGEEAIDLNIAKINGISFNTNPIITYGLNGNVTIDFNVFSKSNARLNLDLNISKSVIQGTGAVIIKDLNLTSEYCPDQDWDDEPSECSFPNFNYEIIDDGNYTIIGLLSTAINSDFNVGDGTFAILNNVNLFI